MHTGFNKPLSADKKEERLEDRGTDLTARDASARASQLASYAGVYGRTCQAKFANSSAKRRREFSNISE